MSDRLAPDGLNGWIPPFRHLMEDARDNMTEQEWTTFMDIVQRFTERELGEDTVEQRIAKALHSVGFGQERHRIAREMLALAQRFPGEQKVE